MNRLTPLLTITLILLGLSACGGDPGTTVTKHKEKPTPPTTGLFFAEERTYRHDLVTQDECDKIHQTGNVLYVCYRVITFKADGTAQQLIEDMILPSTYRIDANRVTITTPDLLPPDNLFVLNWDRDRDVLIEQSSSIEWHRSIVNPTHSFSEDRVYRLTDGTTNGLNIQATFFGEPLSTVEFVGESFSEQGQYYVTANGVHVDMELPTVVMPARFDFSISDNEMTLIDSFQDGHWKRQDLP